MSVTVHAHVDDHAHDHGHHHKETFITKYIFSQDHKMISKQYLITGLIMGFIGIAMSLLFRMQLAWPGESFPIFESVLGKWAPDGVMDADMYLALVTIHGSAVGGPRCFIDPSPQRIACAASGRPVVDRGAASGRRLAGAASPSPSCGTGRYDQFHRRSFRGRRR